MSETEAHPILESWHNALKIATNALTAIRIDDPTSKAASIAANALRDMEAELYEADRKLNATPPSEGA